MSPWMHQLMKVAPVGGGMSADCPPTDKVHGGAQPCRCQHPVPVVASCQCCGFICWCVSSCCLCALPSITAGLIETALSFQAESETVAFTSSSASEKVGQVGARRGRPLTSDAWPDTSTHTPIGVRSHSSVSACCTVSTWRCHHRVWPCFLCVFSPFCVVHQWTNSVCIYFSV